MTTVRITLDKTEVSVPQKSTILETAAAQKIAIPTLCHLNGYAHTTSCMVCVVYEVRSGRLIPACSAPVAEGMIIETNNEKVREARRDALDLLLSEHVGDCEAPCMRACPAQMNIPLMIRQIEDGRLEDAAVTVKRNIALPAVLGRICSAPCEKACHRKVQDEAVSICALKRHVADVDLAQNVPFQPEINPSSGKTVAVIGAGPAGLAAAYYLAQFGHACCVFDANSQPGGMLRYGVSEEKLPRPVLDAEIARIAEMGVKFVMGRTLGKNLEWSDVKASYDAVVVAVGAVDPSVFADSGLSVNPKGIDVNRRSFETSLPGVFAVGNAVSESQMAIRALAHGQSAAVSIDRFFLGREAEGPVRRFNSIIGKLKDGEIPSMIMEAKNIPRLDYEGGFEEGYSKDEAVLESSRCFGCDCRKPQDCRLRRFADEYGANQRRFQFGQRRHVEKVLQHDLVIYEPGKCIKCGLCVQITERHKESLGLTFVDRGFDVRVATPFEKSMKDGLTEAAEECVQSCPTAALSWISRTEG